MSDVKYPSYADKDPKRRSLGHWITSQRQDYQKGKISKERIRKLEQIPGWSWDVHAEQWSAKYNELEVFVLRNKRFPFQHNPTENPLAAWVTKQRKTYIKNRLSKEKIRLLEKIPKWEWKPHANLWSKKYQKLLQFVKEKGTHPSGYENRDPKERVLARWVTRQRQAYHKGELSQERTDLLEQIPGWSWDSINDQWKMNYETVSTYTNLAYSKNPKALWIKNQRVTHRRGKLSQERIKLLEAIPGWFWAK